VSTFFEDLPEFQTLVRYHQYIISETVLYIPGIHTIYRVCRGRWIYNYLCNQCLRFYKSNFWGIFILAVLWKEKKITVFIGITSTSNQFQYTGSVVVVGFTTTCAISAYHHYSCEFESRSWRGVLDTSLCDKVCQM
jgi:hypothetical protein